MLLVRNPYGLAFFISLSDKLSIGSFFFFFCLFAISWAASTAHGGSQASGLIGAVAAGLCQSHSNAKSEASLRPTPQLVAMPDS